MELDSSKSHSVKKESSNLKLFIVLVLIWLGLHLLIEQKISKLTHALTFQKEETHSLEDASEKKTAREAFLSVVHSSQLELIHFFQTLIYHSSLIHWITCQSRDQEILLSGEVENLDILLYFLKHSALSFNIHHLQFINRLVRFTLLLNRIPIDSQFNNEQA